MNKVAPYVGIPATINVGACDLPATVIKVTAKTVTAQYDGQSRTVVFRSTSLGGWHNHSKNAALWLGRKLKKVVDV